MRVEKKSLLQSLRWDPQPATEVPQPNTAALRFLSHPGTTALPDRKHVRTRSDEPIAVGLARRSITLSTKLVFLFVSVAEAWHEAGSMTSSPGPGTAGVPTAAIQSVPHPNGPSRGAGGRWGICTARASQGTVKQHTVYCSRIQVLCRCVFEAAEAART